jgi:hypothetical protein
MIGTELHDHVVEQGRLLLRLLSTLRSEHAAEGPHADPRHLTAMLLAGIDRIHRDLEVLLGGLRDVADDAEDGPSERPYREIVAHIREQLPRLVHSRAVVAVVSRGDGSLVDLRDVIGWHFPQNEVGTWAGYHPVNGAAALAHLDELRARGATHLLIPETSRWWLDWYGEFAEFLSSSCTTVVNDDAMILFALPPVMRPISPARAPARSNAGALATLLSRMLPPGANVVEICADRDDGSVRTRAHRNWGSGLVEERIIDDLEIGEHLRVHETDGCFVVVDAAARDRLSRLRSEEQDRLRARCLFDRAGVGAVFELRDQSEPNYQGASA